MNILNCALLHEFHLILPTYGLLANHAYSIIDCQEVNGHKLMRIRNPWGKGVCIITIISYNSSKEWKGAWSDGSR